MYAEATKVCINCKLEKPLIDFYRRALYGHNSYCKACHNVRRSTNKKTLRKLDPVAASAANAAVKYGLTKNEAINFHLVPCCQACGELLDQGDHRIDHCHELGHVRGVLCQRCNMACAGPSDAAAKRLAGCVEYLNRDVERLA